MPYDGYSDNTGASWKNDHPRRIPATPKRKAKRGLRMPVYVGRGTLASKPNRKDKTEYKAIGVAPGL